MRLRFQLSAALLREHRSGYVAFAALLVLGGILSAAELVLFLALGSGAGIPWAEYSVVEQAVMRNALEGSAGLFRFMGGITTVISLILVFCGFRAMMASRQRELGQMRILGASPGQLRLLIAAEAGTFATVALVPSVLLGWLCATPLFLGLKRLGVFTDAITLNMGFPAAALAALLVLLVGCTVLAAWLSVRPRETSNVLEAAQFTPATATQRRMGTRRIVWAAAAVGLLLVFLVVAPRGDDANAYVSLLLPLLIVLPLATLAPVLIPPVARAIATLIAPLAGGPAVLVAQRAARDARRFSASVLPILVLMGVMTGFAIGSSPDNANLRQQVEAEFDAPFVLQSENRARVDATGESIRAALGPGAATRFTATTLLLDTAQQSGPFTLFNFADFTELSGVVTLEVLAGDVRGLGPDEVISARPGDALGDEITVTNGANVTATLTVAAVVREDMFFTGLVLDWSLLARFQPTTWDSGVLLSEAGASHARAEPAGDAAIVTRAEYAEQQVAARESGAAAGNIALFGTTYAIALIAMIQGLAAATLQRRAEFEALRQLGASRPQILLQLLVEALVLTLSCAVLLACSSAVMIWRFFSERSESVGELVAQVAWGQLGAAFLAVSGVFAATAILAGIAATRRPRSERRPRAALRLARTRA